MDTKELTGIRPLRGKNFYQADPSFSQLLKTLVGEDQLSVLEDRLRPFVDGVSGRWDELAEEAELDTEGPHIQSYDFVGRAVDRVWLPEPTRTIRREVVLAGIFKNETQVEQFAKVYMLSHLGEVGVVCPLACTEGLIRVIRAVGSDFLKERYLPQLLSAETPLAGSQFITEQDMGSDVGAMTTKASPLSEGKWSLEGEKWFCSAIDEFFLIAARPEGAPEGTDGVAIYFVPRAIDGMVNNLRIKRLKEKIGTRQLPTAEIDLNGAIAYNIGPVEKGFKHLMNYVINTSRVMNAASALGCMARAWLEAKNYAEQRSAFGQKISAYPMVQESLMKMESLLAARRALYFRMLARMDKHTISDLRSDEAYWQRFLLNLCKYRTAIGATECAHEGILMLAGNGTVETFSILPRLYRDSIVIENWEGTHNTLALQIARDGLRFPFKTALDVELKRGLEALKAIQCQEVSNEISAYWKQLFPKIECLSDEKWVSRHARHFVDHLGTLLETLAFAQHLASVETKTPETKLLEFYWMNEKRR